MIFDEPDPLKRRIPIDLEDLDGAVTGADLTGLIKVSLDGGALHLSTGSWGEYGSGSYYYEATQAESCVLSFLMVKVNVPDLLPYVYAQDVGNRIISGTTEPAALRLPVYLQNVSGDEVLSATGSVFTSVGGATLSAAAGTLVQISEGCYYYQGVAADVVTEGLLLLSLPSMSGGALPYTYSVDVISAADAVATHIASADEGSYVGDYLGGQTESEDILPPDAVPVPVEFTEELSTSRLPQQFRGKAS